MPPPRDLAHSLGHSLDIACNTRAQLVGGARRTAAVLSVPRGACRPSRSGPRAHAPDWRLGHGCQIDEPAGAPRGPQRLAHQGFLESRAAAAATAAAAAAARVCPCPRQSLGGHLERGAAAMADSIAHAVQVKPRTFGLIVGLGASGPRLGFQRGRATPRGHEGQGACELGSRAGQGSRPEHPARAAKPGTSELGHLHLHL